MGEFKLISIFALSIFEITDRECLFGQEFRQIFPVQYLPYIRITIDCNVFMM